MIFVFICIMLLKAISSSSSSSSSSSMRRISRKEWLPIAERHAVIVQDLLYPKGETDKQRLHKTKEDPIYNFLHRYYRYPIADLKKFSPGIDVIIEDVDHDDVDKFFIKKYLHRLESFGADSFSYFYKPIHPIPAEGSKGWINISRVKTILESTIKSSPNFACFGLHEWAMLYSGRVNTLDVQSVLKKNGELVNLEKPLDRHQDAVPLRVSQEVIDDIVEGIGLHCTHYDAFRFFHPRAQPFNDVNPLKRDTQHEHEQSGCIHATMDLFKYTYQLYPYVDSELLVQSIQLALDCRKIDMLASPYDVSQYVEEEPIRIETLEGRKRYILEQEKLLQRAQPIRKKLHEQYSKILNFSIPVKL